MSVNEEIVDFHNTVKDIREIIATGRDYAYQATNKSMILTYWQVGKRIVEQEQNGDARAEYGKALIETLADELTKEFGSNYSKRNLQYYRKFYLSFSNEEIVNARVHFLTWTHFRSLLRVLDEDARMWYMNEAAKENWSSRTLDRNISTQYYYRLLQSPKKDKVVTEMQEKSKVFQNDKFELIKNPFVAEFLGFRPGDHILKASSNQQF